MPRGKSNEMCNTSTKFLPWVGYFNKVKMVDRFVHLDDVQFTEKQFQNRTRVRNDKGWQWVTVPVTGVEHGVTLIKDVKIANEHKWAPKIIRTIKVLYRNTPYFDKHFSYLEWILGSLKWEYLADLNEALIEHFAKELEIDTEFKRSKDYGEPDQGVDYLVYIVKKAEANEYVTGSTNKYYHDPEKFNQEKITVISQNFEHPTYKQKFNGFVDKMSIIDLLMNEDKETCIQLL